MITVVTGASTGVGLATALEFARRGVDVALLARNAERLEAAAEEVRGQGVGALPIVTDVADADAVDAAAARIEDELGSIDIWVNNAMATIFAPIERITPEEFRRANDPISGRSMGRWRRCRACVSAIMARSSMG